MEASETQARQEATNQALSEERQPASKTHKVYQALGDVSIPKPVALLDESKPDGEWVTEGVTYPRGALISEEWLTPRDRKRAENGDLAHVLQESDQEIPEGYVTGGTFIEPEQGVFFPEHEAEATALKIAGHAVVPKEQEMEFLSSSAKHDREYQEAVKEHGLDRRPVVEMLQQESPRVPDEMLYGSETRTGLPHWRGQEGGQEDALNESRQDSSDDEAEKDSAARPAPGSTTLSETKENPQGVGQEAQGQAQESQSQSADTQTVQGNQ